ncbi:hypothetical protein [Noviherbaspirillum saxi]|uniref:hypothetical protein n=1 Tax=Noviherbaspirillum saxi TaxID=2320863 RepID=UPI0013144F80|nr:hypothetical protein [Noviherbaspirillum saxi]
MNLGSQPDAAMRFKPSASVGAPFMHMPSIAPDLMNRLRNAIGPIFTGSNGAGGWCA